MAMRKGQNCELNGYGGIRCGTFGLRKVAASVKSKNAGRRTGPIGSPDLLERAESLTPSDGLHLMAER